MTGDLIKVDTTLNNDSSKVKRINYKFRWIDREGMRAAEEEVLKPTHDVREQQPSDQLGGALEQGRGLPPDPAEPGIATATQTRCLEASAWLLQANFQKERRTLDDRPHP